MGANLWIKAHISLWKCINYRDKLEHIWLNNDSKSSLKNENNYVIRRYCEQYFGCLLWWTNHLFECESTFIWMFNWSWNKLPTTTNHVFRSGKIIFSKKYFSFQSFILRAYFTLISRKENWMQMKKNSSAVSSNEL